MPGRHCDFVGAGSGRHVLLVLPDSAPSCSDHNHLDLFLQFICWPPRRTSQYTASDYTRCLTAKSPISISLPRLHPRHYLLPQRSQTGLSVPADNRKELRRRKELVPLRHHLLDLALGPSQAALSSCIQKILISLNALQTLQQAPRDISLH